LFIGHGVRTAAARNNDDWLAYEALFSNEPVFETARLMRRIPKLPKRK
jgi:hypothetical protein